MTPALMIQGTGSDAGKSVLLAGLARAYARRGLRVRPFKPQNMSNNAAVTAEGGEIGRAQALQARACGVLPSVHMNPVLIKPEGDCRAQLVVHGRVAGRLVPGDFRGFRERLLPAVIESFRRVGADADLVLAEGAGSPAEVNLRHGDIANMGFAEAADVPVVLVGDIDRGGVIAGIVGTHALLPATERARLRGYVVNKFRGDVRLFDGGIAAIAERTGLACLGVVPFLPEVRRLPSEDTVVLDHGAPQAAAGALRVAVPLLPRIANFDDLDPLAAEDGVAVDLVPPGRALPADANLVILPGSKATLADLAFLRAEGWDVDILAHVRRGGRVLGLCAGYQMLGRLVADPDGVEGERGAAPGLGLLDVETVLGPRKRLAEVAGVDAASAVPVTGYEMHMGVTTGPDRARPLLRIGGAPEGARSADGRVAGCYLHGLFAGDAFRRAFLAELGHASANGVAYWAWVDGILDRLADRLEASLDLDRMLRIARGG